MEIDFKTPVGTFYLQRDTLEDKNLRGWDTSDSYALDTFKSDFESTLNKDSLNIIEVNG